MLCERVHRIKGVGRHVEVRGEVGIKGGGVEKPCLYFLTTPLESSPANGK